MRFWAHTFLSLFLAAGFATLPAQTTTLVEPPTPLLPQAVGTLRRSGDAVTGDDAAQADAANAAVLREDGFQRFARAQYNGVPVLALQFNDASGARAAFSSYVKSGARFLKPADRNASEVASSDGRTYLLKQTVLLIGESANADTTLSSLTPALPRVGGPRSQPPLLPTFFPLRGLVPGSVRYALGPAGYAAEGGTLAPQQLGWEKSAESAIAQYADRRGKETLTLFLYPTPQIAGDRTRALESQVGAQGKLRREGELVLLAQGSFKADDAQNLIENIHLRSEVSFNKEMEQAFPTEIRKTYSLLTSIAVLFGVLALAAVLLGLFLGGGRALVRKMRGKDAATEAEFLSLHLDPQNPFPKFEPPLRQ